MCSHSPLKSTLRLGTIAVLGFLLSPAARAQVPVDSHWRSYNEIDHQGRMRTHCCSNTRVQGSMPTNRQPVSTTVIRHGVPRRSNDMLFPPMYPGFGGPRLIKSRLFGVRELTPFDLMRPIKTRRMTGRRSMRFRSSGGFNSSFSAGQQRAGRGGLSSFNVRSGLVLGSNPGFDLQYYVNVNNPTGENRSPNLSPFGTLGNLDGKPGLNSGFSNVTRGEFPGGSGGGRGGSGGGGFGFGGGQGGGGSSFRRSFNGGGVAGSSGFLGNRSGNWSFKKFGSLGQGNFLEPHTSLVTRPLGAQRWGPFGPTPTYDQLFGHEEYLARLGVNTN